ncbi:MAG TPA: VOC family protein [Acidimicrobiales bacterium]|nr:VOC family protein [Acidimicrobiales bacterium]
MTTTTVGVRGFSHVAIAVDDLEAARDFYCGVFGFEEVARPDFGIPGMWLAVGDLQLHFVETDVLPSPGKGFPHYALHVPTDRFDETVAALETAGVRFLGAPSERVDFGVTTVRAAFVADPAGNVIELTDA